eukprot:g3577.t1
MQNENENENEKSIFQGHLNIKQKKIFRSSWTLYYFLLDSDFKLSWYETQFKENLVGFAQISSKASVNKISSSKGDFAFEIDNGDEKLILRAQSNDDEINWTTSIRKCVNSLVAKRNNRTVNASTVCTEEGVYGVLQYLLHTANTNKDASNIIDGEITRVRHRGSIDGDTLSSEIFSLKARELNLRLPELDVADIGSALKLYLKNLENPPLPLVLYKPLLQAFKKNCNEGDSAKIVLALNEVLMQAEDLSLLMNLILFLGKTQKVPVARLAHHFGPHIIRPREPPQTFEEIMSIKSANSIVALLIDFPVNSFKGCKGKRIHFSGGEAKKSSATSSPERVDESKVNKNSEEIASLEELIKDISNKLSIEGLPEQAKKKLNAKVQSLRKQIMELSGGDFEDPPPPPPEEDFLQENDDSKTFIVRKQSKRNIVKRKSARNLKTKLSEKTIVKEAAPQSARNLKTKLSEKAPQSARNLKTKHSSKKVIKEASPHKASKDLTSDTPLQATLNLLREARRICPENCNDTLQHINAAISSLDRNDGTAVASSIISSSKKVTSSSKKVTIPSISEKKTIELSNPPISFDHYFWSHMFSFLGANGMFYLSLLCRQLNEYSHSVHCVEAWKKICFNLVKDQFSGDEQILQDVKCLANPNEASLCDTDLDKLANPYINLAPRLAMCQYWAVPEDANGNICPQVIIDLGSVALRAGCDIQNGVPMILPIQKLNNNVSESFASRVEYSIKFALDRLIGSACFIENETALLVLTGKSKDWEVYRREICEMIFERFKPWGLRLIDASFSGFCVFGEGTGVVVDVGYNYTRILPVYSMMVLSGSKVDIEIGGKSITEKLQALIKEKRGVHLPLSDVETIKKLHCFVKCKESDEKAEISFDMSGDADTSIVLGDELWEATEILFEPQLCGKYFDGIAASLHKIIKSCPLDAIGGMLRNIVIIGGGGMLKGFKKRLLEELRPLWPPRAKLNVQSHETMAQLYSYVGATMMDSFTRGKPKGLVLYKEFASDREGAISRCSGKRK